MKRTLIVVVIAFGVLLAGCGGPGDAPENETGPAEEEPGGGAGDGAAGEDEGAGADGGAAGQVTEDGGSGDQTASVASPAR